MDPRELLSGLSRPDAFPEAGPTVDVVQTHVSIVFLTGARAYKVKKSLSLWGFLDYSTPERRREMCEAEVRLNRRLAHDVYLGVLPVVRRGGRLFVGGAGEAVDHAVVMRRLEPGVTLAERIAAGTASPAEAKELADLLRRFHATTAGGAEAARVGRPVTFARILRQNLSATRRAVPEVFPASVHRWFGAGLAARLRASRRLLARRAGERRLVDGHGDLRAEHCVRTEGPAGPSWQVIDCIEFTPLLRYLDPLSDAAFLAMDLDALGRRDLSAAFTESYLGEPRDPDAATLWPLYLAYRAHVRAKVDAHRATEGEIPEEDRERARTGARRHLALACGYLLRGAPPPLVLVGGLSGAGKSAVARAIASALGARVHASDRVRKELAGVAPTARLAGPALDRLYGPDLSRRTYATLLERAEAALAAGEPALLDATYLRHDARRGARDLARRLRVPFVVVWIEVPEAVARARIEARARADLDPSDATWAVHEAQRAAAEPPGAAEADVLVRFDGTRPPDEVHMPLWERLVRPA